MSKSYRIDKEKLIKQIHKFAQEWWIEGAKTSHADVLNAVLLSLSEEWCICDEKTECDKHYKPDYKKAQGTSDSDLVRIDRKKLEQIMAMTGGPGNEVTFNTLLRCLEGAESSGNDLRDFGKAKDMSYMDKHVPIKPDRRPHDFVGDGGEYTMCKKCKCFPHPQGDNKKYVDECKLEPKEKEKHTSLDSIRQVMHFNTTFKAEVVQYLVRIINCIETWYLPNKPEYNIVKEAFDGAVEDAEDTYDEFQPGRDTFVKGKGFESHGEYCHCNDCS